MMGDLGGLTLHEKQVSLVLLRLTKRAGVVVFAWRDLTAALPVEGIGRISQGRVREWE